MVLRTDYTNEEIQQDNHPAAHNDANTVVNANEAGVAALNAVYTQDGVDAVIRPEGAPTGAGAIGLAVVHSSNAAARGVRVTSETDLPAGENGHVTAVYPKRKDATADVVLTGAYQNVADAIVFAAPAIVTAGSAPSYVIHGMCYLSLANATGARQQVSLGIFVNGVQRAVANYDGEAVNSNATVNVQFTGLFTGLTTIELRAANAIGAAGSTASTIGLPFGFVGTTITAVQHADPAFISNNPLD